MITEALTTDNTPIRAPFLTASGQMSDALEDSPGASTFTFVTTSGAPAGSWDTALGGDAFSRMHRAGLWISQRSGIPIETLVPVSEHRILHFVSLWPHEHRYGNWHQREPIRYRVYEDDALTQADRTRVMSQVRVSGDGQLIFTEGPAMVSGPFEEPNILHDQD